MNMEKCRTDFQCGITTGHLAHIFDHTERQIRDLRKKREGGQDGALIPKQGRRQSEARVHAQCNIRDKVRRDPVRTVAQLSKVVNISWFTSSRVMDHLNLRSRAHQRRQKVTARDKCQHLQRGR